MTVPVYELGLTALLVLAFACLGVLLLRRWPRDIVEWNLSFLTGAVACAAALFPISLVLPHAALAVTAGILAVAFAVVLGGRLRRGPRATPGRPNAMTATSLGLLLTIAAVGVVFAFLTLRHLYLWDGFQIWASKAQILFAEGGLGRAWYAGDGYDRRLLAYPPLVPLFEALLAFLRHGFAFDVLKPVFLVFHGSLLVSVYGAARARLTAQRALLATLLVALLPGISTWYAAGGYADMPLAAVVAAAVAAAFREKDARALPWMVGGLTVVKNEGLILAAIGGLAVAGFWASGGWRRAPGRAVAHVRGVAVFAAFVATRVAYVAWLGVDDPTFRKLGDPGSLAEAQRRLLHVGRLTVESMLDVPEWGLLWPAFFAAGAVLLLRGDARERCLVAATGLAAAAYGAIFLMTNWSLELHLVQALPRLLAQIAPAALLSVAFAASRALSPAPAYDPAEAT